MAPPNRQFFIEVMVDESVMLVVCELWEMLKVAWYLERAFLGKD